MADYSVKAIISAEDRGFSDAFDKALKTVSNFKSKLSSSMSAASKDLQTIGKTLTIAGAATTAMGIKSVQAFGQFQQSLNTAAVVAGGTSKNIKELADVANKMGADLPLSAQDAADAMIEMARNGASISSIKEQFPAIAKAATAAGSDLKATAGVVQLAMNVWGKSLKSPAQAAEYLVQTANLSNASVEDMQQVIGTLGPTANLAGYGMRDMSTAIGLVTNSGMSAANAAQDINFALLKMMAPTKVSAGAMKDLGLKVRDAHGNMKPLPAILEQVAKATAHMSKAERDAVLKNLWGTAGMKAMIPLLETVKNKTGDASTSWNAFSKALDNAAGTTAKANKSLDTQAAEMQKNIGAKIEQLGGNWEALTNTAMQANQNVTGAVLDMLNSILTWAQGSNSAIAQVIQGFIGISPVLGPVMTAVSGFIVQFKNITGVIKAFVSPVGLALAVLAGLSAIFAKAYSSSSNLRKSISEIGTAFSSVFGPAIKSAITGFNSFISALTGGTSKGNNAFKILGDSIANVLNGINWANIAGTIKNVFDGIGQAVSQVVQYLSQVGTAFIQSSSAANLWNSVVSIAQSIWNVLQQVGIAVSQVVQGFMQTGAVSAIWQMIVTVLKTVWTTLQSVVTIIGSFITAVGQVLGATTSGVGGSQSIWQNLGTVIGNIVTIISNIITVIANIATQIISVATNIITTIINIVTPIVTTIVRIATQVVQGIMTVFNGLVTFFTTLWTTISTTASNIWNSFISGMQPIIAAIQNLWNALVPFFQTLWTGIVTVATTIWNMIVIIMTPIIQAIIAVWNTLTSAFSAIMQVIQTVWSTAWNVISTVVSTVWSAISTVVSTGINLVANIIKTVTAALKGDWSSVWNGIKSIVSTIWNGIKSLAETIFNGIKTVITNVWNGVKSITSSVWNGIKSVVTSVVNGIKSVITSVFNAIKTIVTTVWNGIKTVTSTVWNSIKSLVTSVINAVKSAVTSGMNGVKSAVTSAMNAVKSAFVAGWNAARNAITNGVRACVNAARSMVGAMASAGRDFVMGFVRGISGAIGQAAQAAARMAQSAVNAAKKFLHIHSPSRVMRDQVGYYVVAGMAKGIDQNTKMVVDSATRLATAAIPSINPAQFNNQIQALNSRAKSSLTGQFSQQLNINQHPAYINVSLGGHDYSTFVDDISTEQDKQIALKRKRF